MQSNMAVTQKKETKVTIQEILLERNLNPNIFNFVPSRGIDAEIEDHVRWVYGNIYSHHYPSSRDSKNNRDKIARMHHGIQHVTRAAIYILVFANLYRLFKNEAALKLTDEDIKLLQIAALFHDAARLDDGVDYWDEQSGRMLYEYLIHIGVSKEKALMLADAVANKDRYPAANIYQELLQNADCLDIKRVRKIFDAKFLYFYKNIASKNETAFLLMAKLIREVYGLIVWQGDYFELKLDLIKKKEYQKDAYRKIMNDIHTGYPDPLTNILDNKHSILSTYPILKDLSQELLDLSDLENLAKKYLTETNPLMKVMNEGNIFFRGIRFPSRLALKKEIVTPEGKVEREDSGAELEVIKTERVFGRETRSKKSNNKQKNGNPNRSVTMVGHGSTILFPAGYCIFYLTDIQRIEAKDFDTGFGKKRHLSANSVLNLEEQQIQKSKIIYLQQMGGVLSKSEVYSHNEIIARLTKFDGVMYTLDSKSERLNDLTHPFVAILEAICLRFEYYRQTNRWLPYYEYSGQNNFIKAREDFTDEQIIEIWKIICLIYMQNLEKNNYGLLKLLDLPVESILKLALYVKERYEKHTFLDSLRNYPQALKEKIHITILEEKNQILKNHKRKLKDYFLQRAIDEFMNVPSLNLLLLYRFKLLNNSLIRKKILTFLKSDALMQYIRNGKVRRFDIDYNIDILNNYCISIKESPTPLTLYNDREAIEAEEKLYYYFVFSDCLKLPKIMQEIQKSVLNTCFSHLSSYRKDDTLTILPHDAILSLYLATTFRVNREAELFNKIKQYIRLSIENSQIFSKRFENKIYTTIMGRRRNELSLIYNGIELLSHFSYPVKEEIDLLFDSWVSNFPIFQNREITFFERYPQFTELDIWPQDALFTKKDSELSNNPNLTEEYKEFFEILAYPIILADMLIFLRKNPQLDIEKKGEETHYQKILGCFVSEILRQMPTYNDIRGEDIFIFFAKAYIPFIDHAGLFLKLLQNIEISYPSLFKQYLQGILTFTKINYIDQFKEIEDFYKLKPMSILPEEKKYDIEVKAPCDDSKACIPKFLIQHAMVDQTPNGRRYYFFSKIKSSSIIELLKHSLEQDQAKKALEEDFPPILCTII